VLSISTSRDVSKLLFAVSQEILIYPKNTTSHVKEKLVEK